MRTQRIALSASNRMVARMIVLMIGVSAVACAGSVAPSPTRSPTAPMVASPTPSSAANVLRSVPTRTPIAATGAITLTLWTTEDLAPGSTPDGKIWRSQFDAFTAANPNIYINIVLKNPAGKGGLLDFLATTSAIVPSQLPDLVVLDIADIPTAFNTGALQSLDGMLPLEMTSDLFPFASQAARYSNQWVAVPFVADIQHFVYRQATVKTPPKTWDDLYRQRYAILMPLAGDDAFTVQYAAIAPSTATTTQLDLTATTAVLNFFKRAHDLGLMSEVVVGLKSSADDWTAFVAGQAPQAQVMASRYIAERDTLSDAQFAQLPTRDGNVATLASGSAFAITTSDPARQTAAARFIQWIVQADRLSTWLRAARKLPAHRSLINQVIEPTQYAIFLREELEHATYFPHTPVYNKAADAWRAAITNIWKGQTTPDEAARAVIAASK
jgi:ABC-type glycerol-3-phosphate transport system substrate-binding protein